MEVKSEKIKRQYENSTSKIPTDQNLITDYSGIKFQRLMQGGLLLLALFFKWIPLVYFVLLVMGTAACFSQKFALFSILYTKIIKPSKSTQEKMCECNPDKGEQRFACALGSFFLLMAIIFNYLNFSFGWVCVGLVSALSLLAGTTNFCLGSLLFVLFRSLSSKREK